MIRFEATHANGHAFIFEAPSDSHESIPALRSIGYGVTEIARLREVERYVKAFGGVYQATVAVWV
jgi:hypothetical protein